jgi:hypothetical protein
MIISFFLHDQGVVPIVKAKGLSESSLTLATSSYPFSIVASPSNHVLSFDRFYQIIMLFSQVCLYFVASAFTTYIWLGWKSGKNSIHCLNMRPNQWCGTSVSPFTSIDLREIPTNWDILVQCHRGPQCGRVNRIESSRGRDNVRVDRGGPCGGAGYAVNSRRTKRAEEGCAEACAETMRPSILSFADGVHYNLTEIDDAPFSQMVCVFNLYAYFGNYSF